MLVFAALQALLKRSLLCNEDVDLEIFVGRGRRIFLFLLILATTSCLVITSLLVDEAFKSEEVGDKSAFLHHVLRNGPDYANHTRQETLDRVVLEEDMASEKLGQDASQTPNIYLVIVAASKDDFRGAIGARLNVATQMIMNEAAAAKVDHFDFTARVRFNENVLRLQITVDKFEIMAERERVQDLLCDALQARHVEVNLLLNLSVVL